MAPPSSSIFFFSFLLLLSSPAFAFNVTKILAEFPYFSTLNALLSQTKLAAEINSRSTITILAFDNGADGAISGKPVDEQKRILSIHVALDYYDGEKLTKLSKKSLLITMYESIGLAVNQQ